MMLSLIMFSCQREAIDRNTAGGGSDFRQPASSAGGTATTANKAVPTEDCNPAAYNISLENKSFINGNWVWTWSVENPNPGNGQNGTAKDLSHWGMQFGTCVNPSSIVEAAYSGDGLNWTTFPPVVQVDPSQGCLQTPLLKFDFGTTGAAKSYYRLTVNQDYSAGFVPGYFKTGGKTGCCPVYINGISGCGGPVEIEIVE